MWRVYRGCDTGEALADAIMRRFRLGVTLELENIYLPYLLIANRQETLLLLRGCHVYGRARPCAPVRERRHAKGIELVRRDNCPFAKAVRRDVLDALLVARGPPQAVAHLRRATCNLAELIGHRRPTASRSSPLY